MSPRSEVAAHLITPRKLRGDYSFRRKRLRWTLLVLSSVSIVLSAFLAAPDDTGSPRLVSVTRAVRSFAVSRPTTPPTWDSIYVDERMGGRPGSNGASRDGRDWRPLTR